MTREAKGTATNRPTPSASAPTSSAATATSHTSSALAKFDQTSEKLDVNAVMADCERSMTNGIVNCVKMPRMSPGRKQRADAMAVILFAIAALQCLLLLGLYVFFARAPLARATEAVHFHHVLQDGSLRSQ